MKYFLFLLVFFLLVGVVQARKIEVEEVSLKVEIQRPEINFLASLANFFRLNRSICLQVLVGSLVVINLFLNKERRER